MKAKASVAAAIVSQKERCNDLDKLMQLVTQYVELRTRDVRYVSFQTENNVRLFCTLSKDDVWLVRKLAQTLLEKRIRIESERLGVFVQELSLREEKT